MRRLKIKLTETIGKLGSLITNRRLSNLTDYNKNLNNFERCFLEKKTPSLSDNKIDRICNAYQSAISKEVDNEKYSVSDEWIPVYQKYMGEILEALKNGDREKVRDNYDNFYRRKCSAGLVGLPTNMNRFYDNYVNELDKRWFLNDSIYRIQYLKSKIKDLDLKKLASTNYGNPYGVYIDNTFLRNGSDYQYYYARKLHELCKETKHKTKKIVEIGGGYGGVASFLLQDEGVDQYINYDLPENLALATYTLMTIFPEKEFVLYGEIGADKINFDNKRLVMLPAHSIEDLKAKDLSVAFNSFSFSEMNIKAAKNYINILSDLKTSFFFHVNHVQNSRTSANNLAPPSYHLVERAAANWNLGRSSTCDEFEFLYAQAN